MDEYLEKPSVYIQVPTLIHISPFRNDPVSLVLLYQLFCVDDVLGFDAM